MKVGVVGFPGVGKTTVFCALSGQDVPAHSSSRPMAVVEVVDRRLDQLRDVFTPKKFTRARFDVEECPALPKGDARGRGEAVASLRGPEALLVVVGVFEEARMQLDEALHEPAAQLNAFLDELLLLDMEAVERRLERVDQRRKKGGGDVKQLDSERQVLQDLGARLEEGRWEKAPEVDREAQRVRLELGLFADKALVPVFNFEEGAEGGQAALDAATRRQLRGTVLCAPVEAEISQLQGEDRSAFLQEYGLEEPASERLTQLAYDALDLISFFTVGPDEVRAWPVRRGSDAVTAAGKIHTDLARGFIRAEVTPYAQVEATRDPREFKAASHAELMGKDYVVEDGDILNIRFSV